MELKLTHGSFRLGIAALDKKLVQITKHEPIYPGTCSDVFRLTTDLPVVAGSGTGAYRGITGGFTVTLAGDEAQATALRRLVFSWQVLVIAGSDKSRTYAVYVLKRPAAWLRRHPRLADGLLAACCCCCPASQLSGGSGAACLIRSATSSSASCSPPPSYRAAGIRWRRSPSRRDRRGADRLRHPASAGPDRSGPCSRPMRTWRSWCCSTPWPRTGHGGYSITGLLICLVGGVGAVTRWGPAHQPNAGTVGAARGRRGLRPGADRVGARRLRRLPLPADPVRRPGGTRARRARVRAEIPGETDLRDSVLGVRKRIEGEQCAPDRHEARPKRSRAPGDPSTSDSCLDAP